MDRHLNIFNFFNANNEDYLEDNLSRAFALCLKYDSVFLDKILQSVLSENIYSKLFNTDFPDYKINIDLQNRVNELEGFSKIIAVACSGKEIANFESVIARETNSPETDVCIIVNDTCILFEFKRTSEDCSAQLKCQAEKVKQNCSAETTIEYKDLAWNKIIRILLNVSSLQKQINTESPFTNDFIRFLERKLPEWFPSRLLQNIPFPTDEFDPNGYYLEERLKQITNQIYGEEKTEERTGRFNRYVIKSDFGWIDEIRFEPVQKDGENFIAILFHIGDTKRQGQFFFGKNPQGIEWANELHNIIYEVEPYINFRHFNSQIFKLSLTPDENRNTHNLNFFRLYAGRHTKENWSFVEEGISNFVCDWKTRCDWQSQIEKSNRTYFDMSLTILLKIYLPYKDCQKLDNTELNSELATKIRETIINIRRIIDKIYY
ncbi:MAG: hypothetical protein M3Q99_13360 [Acidobacteriota bacterium]|nr:hypothetical protein [Acidobacteriota bacterium]